MTRRLGSAYELDDLIGRGATGEVWRGRVTDTGETIAAKLLRSEYAEDQEVVARFVQERSILVSLRHPNLVRVHDLVVEGADLAIIMDLVDGDDLRHHLTEVGPRLKPAEAARITAEVLDALAVTHAARVLHRDIKPDNVLLDKTTPVPTVRLSDFGIARLSEGTAVRMSELIGTPEYLAPEVVSSELVSAAADVYAVGILFYELLAGRTPFAGQGNSYAIVKRQVEAEPPPIEGCPPEVWTYLGQLLAKDPTVRPDAVAAASLLRGLSRDLAGLPSLPEQKPVVDWQIGVRSEASGPGTIVRGQRSLQDQGDLDEEPVWVPTSAGQDDRRATRVQDRPVISKVAAPPVPTAPPAPPVDKAKNRRILLIAAAATIAITAGVGFVLLRSDGAKAKPKPKPVAKSATIASDPAAHDNMTRGLLQFSRDYRFSDDGAGKLKLTGSIDVTANKDIPVNQAVRIVVPADALVGGQAVIWGDGIHAVQGNSPTDWDIDVDVAPAANGGQERGQTLSFTIGGIDLKGADPEATLAKWLSSDKAVLDSELKPQDFGDLPLIPLLVSGIAIKVETSYLPLGQRVVYSVEAVGTDESTGAPLLSGGKRTSLLDELEGGGAVQLKMLSEGGCVEVAGFEVHTGSAGTCALSANLGALNATSEPITVVNA